ncbi:MAG: hypothetical protein NTW78_05730 [Campylobacterales bacterium]|nr:hypothetical protein [Campylobacterales bacterium]
MKHISSISGGVALGSAGLIMMSLISGCETQEQKQHNKFLIIEKLTNDKYIIVEEMPTDGPSRAIIREKDADGKVTERILNEEEMKALASEEYKKVENGTSETVSNNQSGGGMGLAGTILAAAGGALMGNMIANSLMNNKNFSRNAASANQSAYSRSAPSAGGTSTGGASAASTSTAPKKSFFGSSSGSTSSAGTSSTSSSSYGS